MLKNSTEEMGTSTYNKDKIIFLEADIYTYIYMIGY